MNKAPLSGIRVLDMTWAMAGPYAALQLALLGAEVIKVETMSNLDGMRRGIYALDGDIEQGPTFNSLNMNKLGLRLNLKTADGLAAFKQLAKIADVVVENFRPGVLDRMGLGYGVLKQHNPTIIVASSSAFGAEGPESRRPGYASVFNAVAGLGHLTGYADGPPTEMRDSIDLRVGTSLAYSILAAIFHRQKTGRGQRIDLSSVEAIASLVGHTIVGYTTTGKIAQRQGTADDILAPHGTYPCAGLDQWVTIAVATDEEFVALSQTIGKSQLADNPRFTSAHRRKSAASELNKMISDWTRTRSPAEVTTKLQEVGVAAMAVLSNKDVAEDPHLRARGVFTTVKHPRLGDRTVQNLAWRTTGPEHTIGGPGPLLGQHNDYLLGALLAMNKGQLEAMAASGAFE